MQGAENERLPCWGVKIHCSLSAQSVVFFIAPVTRSHVSFLAIFFFFYLGEWNENVVVHIVVYSQGIYSIDT